MWLLFAEPADYRAYFVVPHYHQHGTGFQLDLLSGPNEVRTIWRNEGPVGESLSGRLVPPVDLSGAIGFRFSCDYNNTTARPILGGRSADEEMCSFFVHTDGERSWYGVATQGLVQPRLTDLGIRADGLHQFKIEGCAVLDF